MKLTLFTLFYFCLVMTAVMAQGTAENEDVREDQFQEADSFQFDDTKQYMLSFTATNTLDHQKSPIMTPPMGNYRDFKLKKIAIPQGAIVRIYDLDTPADIQSKKCEQKQYLIVQEKLTEK